MILQIKGWGLPLCKYELKKYNIKVIGNWSDTTNASFMWSEKAQSYCIVRAKMTSRKVFVECK